MAKHRAPEPQELDIQQIGIRIGFTLLSGFVMAYGTIMTWILL